MNLVFKSAKGEADYLAAYDRSLSLWPVAFEERDIETPFGSAHAIIAGSGEALVLLHSSLASSTMWYPNIGELASRFRVYAIDSMLEPGKSRPRKLPRKKEELVAHLAAVLDGLGLERSRLAGASRGAWEAAALAAARPARVSKLALLSPAQVFQPIHSMAFFGATLRCAFLPGPRAVSRMARLVFASPENLPREFLEQYELALRHFRLSASLGATPALFTDPELRSLAMPVLLLIGERDIINNEGAIERGKALVPDFRGEVIPEACHILSMDQPAKVDARLIDFFA